MRVLPQQARYNPFVVLPVARQTYFEESAIFRVRLPLILASSSPRRREFLHSLGLDARIMPPPEAAEPSPLAGEAPVSFAVRAARAKAAALCAAPDVPSAAPAPVVIAADTIVVLDGDILGKPRDADHALAMLRSLRGRTHQVITGCALAIPRVEVHTFFVQSSVTFWQCPDSLLTAYAACGEPLDKAGGYAVQGKGAFLAERIEGSWSNVVGLPLAELVRHLLELGAIEAGGRGAVA